MGFLIANAWANTGGKFMPVAGTEIAGRVDNLYSFLLIVSLVACVILLGGMAYFVVRYRRLTPTQETAYITHNTFLEFLWSFIPFVIFFIVFAWGWIIYHDMRTMPENAREVQVTARKWGWTYTYKDGRTSDTLIVPIGEPIKLVMNSVDVLHSFYVPSFRIKQDVVPGRYTALWFEVEKPGDYTVFCTEYCGSGHSAMLSKITAVPLEQYNKWLADVQPTLSLLEQGEKLYAVQACKGCHTTDGSVVVGPSFKGIYGTKAKLDDGTEKDVDDNYIRESILYPAKVAKVEYAAKKGQMPVYQGQLSESDVSALIEYIKSLKN